MKKMKLLFSGLFLFFGLLTNAQDTGKTITQNISASKDHTFLATNITAAGLSQTLSGKGPFTVFAPTDNAFEKSNAINVEKSAKSVSKPELQGLVTYHVVAGKMDSKAIGAAIKSGGGKAVLTTLEGGKLTATLDSSKLMITDEKGNRISVSSADNYCSNGVIHVTDKVFTKK